MVQGDHKVPCGSQTARKSLQSQPMEPEQHLGLGHVTQAGAHSIQGLGSFAPLRMRSCIRSQEQQWSQPIVQLQRAPACTAGFNSLHAWSTVCCPGHE